MDVMEGLRKWAILKYGSPPVGETMSLSLTSKMVSDGSSSIVGIQEGAPTNKSMTMTGKCWWVPSFVCYHGMWHWVLALFYE
jgi:hypothetical protein